MLFNVSQCYGASFIVGDVRALPRDLGHYILVILIDPAQRICTRLYAYHDFPDAARAKLAIQCSKKICQDKKKSPSGDGTTEKLQMYNVHNSKFHDEFHKFHVNLNL
ncbi:hypothetical protein AVEN_244937-1 [Araneus ventricosus]|uniref:Uncharacterized protein n=1 Tax=Araneus ventricosus TaxID=182803 RepID=A0A4Y2F778_ARAVE|nr:hypothetical protein AVEN_244937-1 [Araneus ventricosus]